MALIVINADTETSELIVTVDGVAVADVQAISVYMGKDWYSQENDLCVNIQSMKKDKESGVTTMTTLCAADSSEGLQIKQSGAKASREFPGFVVLTNMDKVKLDILEHFRQF